MKTLPRRHALYGLFLVGTLVISLTAKPAFSNQYDDEEAVNRAAQQLNQIEQDAREEAKHKYNYEHGVIPNSWSEDWKQAGYEAKRKKAEESSRTAEPSSSSVPSPPAPSSTNTPSSVTTPIAANTAAANVTDNDNSTSPFTIIIMLGLIFGVIYFISVVNKWCKGGIKDINLLTIPRKNVNSDNTVVHIEKTCPQCAEAVKYEAKICRFCRHEF